MTDNEWLGFFNAHADKYDNEVFTRDTEREVAFLVELLDLPPGSRILDVGCGTGRHSVALAKHGYAMTGVDLSDGMLAKAAERAHGAGVTVEWVQADATVWRATNPFGAGIGVCEGGIGLLGAGDSPLERDYRVLENMFHSLRPGGVVVLTVLSAFRPVRQFTDEDVAAGRFDPVTLVITSGDTTTGPDGREAKSGRERVYAPSEFVGLLRRAGFVVDHVWGGTAGDWGRRPLKLDEWEFMAVAHRPA